MNIEIDNKVIISDKQININPVINESEINNNINNNINQIKSTETSNKLKLSINEEIIEENNKLIVDNLVEENQKLREIIRLCLLLIGFCRCRNRKNTTHKKQINLLINNYNNNKLLNKDIENFEVLDVNEVINDRNSDNVLGKELIAFENNCDEEEEDLISQSDNEWCEKNSDQDWPEGHSDNELIKNCVNYKPINNSRILSHRKLKQNLVKHKKGSENGKINRNCHKNNKSGLKSKRDVIEVRKRGRIKVVRDPNIVFICDWIGCGKLFKSQSNLNGHKDIHLEVKKYRCVWPGCEAKFLRKEQLDVHISSHTNEKRFKCDWPGCGYGTCHTAKLRTHKRVHTGEKPYRCDWPGCEFSTSYEKGLRRHKMRHTGEKPYKCSWPQCEWSFRQPTHLKAHLLKHTGEKPFICQFIGCDRRFSSRQAMRFHLEKSHK